MLWQTDRTRCRCKIGWYVSKFTAASRGPPCDSTAACIHNALTVALLFTGSPGSRLSMDEIASKACEEVHLYLTHKLVRQNTFWTLNNCSTYAISARCEKTCANALEKRVEIGAWSECSGWWRHEFSPIPTTTTTTEALGTWRIDRHPCITYWKRSWLYQRPL